MTGKTAPAAVRSTYRHGDLRRALLDAGIQLARDGGPEAVVLREATRRTGVAPNAAYRHFANHKELLQAVRSAALSQLAVAIETELAGVTTSTSAAEQARAALRAVGTAYMRFAQDEIGLFLTAFSIPDEMNGVEDKSKAGPGGLNPFELLCAALDRMVVTGALPPERRPGAEFLAWSAVHGMARLVIDGPLRKIPREKLDLLTQRLLVMVENGL